MLWGVVESRVLLNEVARFAAAKDTVRYLDFACGTGRVLSVVEPYTSEAVGVDVSEYMLDLARPKVRRAKLVCTDLTQADATISEKFDLITAFRFLTGAEEPLRWQAVRALRERLRDRDSLLIINTHRNPFSYRLVILPYEWLWSWMHGRQLHYITTRHAKLILEHNGLVVQKVVGMGFIPECLLPLLPRRLALWIQRTLSGAPLVQRFGSNQMFFCHIRDEGA
jgi:SAM-dependent methyltransferase